MKRTTCLILALACTAGCKNIAQMIHSPQSPPPLSEPPIVKLNEARIEENPTNDAKKADGSLHAKPQEENPKRIQNPVTTGGAVAAQLPPTTSRLRKDTFCKASPRPEWAGSTLAKSDAKVTGQVIKGADKPAAKPDIRKTEERPSIADGAGSVSISDSASQGLSKEAWYGIVTICGALFTSILAPLLVDFIKHCIGFGSGAHHPRREYEHY
jgi:hypothetical protein